MQPKVTNDIEDASEFYEIINRQALTHRLSEQRPYVYFSMEVYDQSHGIKGGGGLGVLAADTRRVAERLDVPFVVVTPFYRSESHQSIEDMSQVEYSVSVEPTDFGFELLDQVSVAVDEGFDSTLDIYTKQAGSTQFVTISEPNFGELYSGESSGDHRLYQEVSLGFGGYKALKCAGIKPAVIQLNETATIFAALARLDELVSNGMNLYEAIVYVRKHTLYTNHTLVQAAEAVFSRQQFERYVLVNITSKAVAGWLRDQFVDEQITPARLAVELCEAKNGVSKLHARVADFRDRNGERVKFNAITNGIDMPTWVLPEIFELYQRSSVVDRFGLPTEQFAAAIDQLSLRDIKAVRRQARQLLTDVLAGRLDQYGQPVNLPASAVVFDFKRRFVDYKRPFMPFDNPGKLRQILQSADAHYILTGKVPPGDQAMYRHLNQILNLIDSDEVLRERVHYIQDYDEQLGRTLSIGADVAINTPIVGLEACGTSWEKDIANLKLLISTNDGGVADVQPVACFEVTGGDYSSEVQSLYRNMELACETVRNDAKLLGQLKFQLKGYLPTISGARMLKDYLKFLFPSS